MSDVLSMFSHSFSFLQNTEIMGFSLLSWLVVGCLFGMIGAFIRGKK